MRDPTMASQLKPVMKESYSAVAFLPHQNQGSIQRRRKQQAVRVKEPGRTSGYKETKGLGGPQGHNTHTSNCGRRLRRNRVFARPRRVQTRQ